jgi:hypothetical protein
MLGDGLGHGHAGVIGPRRRFPRMDHTSGCEDPFSSGSTPGTHLGAPPVHGVAGETGLQRQTAFGDPLPGQDHRVTFDAALPTRGIDQDRAHPATAFDGDQPVPREQRNRAQTGGPETEGRERLVVGERGDDPDTFDAGVVQGSHR